MAQTVQKLSCEQLLASQWLHLGRSQSTTVRMSQFLGPTSACSNVTRSILLAHKCLSLLAPSSVKTESPWNCDDFCWQTHRDCRSGEYVTCARTAFCHHIRLTLPATTETWTYDENKTKSCKASILHLTAEIL